MCRRPAASGALGSEFLGFRKAQGLFGAKAGLCGRWLWAVSSLDCENPRVHLGQRQGCVGGARALGSE